MFIGSIFVIISLCVFPILPFNFHIKHIYGRPHLEGFQIYVNCLKDQSKINTLFIIGYNLMMDKHKRYYYKVQKYIPCNKTKIFYVHCRGNYSITMQLDDQNDIRLNKTKMSCRYPNVEMPPLFPMKTQSSYLQYYSIFLLIPILLLISFYFIYLC